MLQTMEVLNECLLVMEKPEYFLALGLVLAPKTQTNQTGQFHIHWGSDQ